MKKWFFIFACLMVGVVLWTSDGYNGAEPATALAEPVAKKSESAANKRQAPPTGPTPAGPKEPVSLDTILGLAAVDREIYDRSVSTLNRDWDDGLTAPVMELLKFLPLEKSVPLSDHLRRWTGQNFQTVNEWYEWYWNQDARPPDWYPDFKARVYTPIDPSFEQYFLKRRGSDIDLTEVRWGGVRRDGIPPLDHPEMITAAKADYLADTDVVFGIINKGDARAYPKRILAWHEMFRDEIGGESIAGVYCTLCGTVIPYKSQDFTIGTSGFLYRSNKVMYDLKTRSLWSTFDGTPVFGPLRGKGIKLDTIPVVTTTWGEWKKRHPKTTVLSLNTGHRRDYSEGAAYRSYFATDKLMFNVPATDKRLKNKDEVLIVRMPGAPMAMAAKFLAKNPVYQDKVGETNFVVLTDSTGANRVYDDGGKKFREYSNGEVKDESGTLWKVHPDHLENSSGQRLNRLPAHRAFWFGWYSAHPKTRLVL